MARGRDVETKIFKVKEITSEIKVHSANVADRNLYPMKVVRQKIELIGKTILVELKRGETKELSNGVKITFHGHSHKSTTDGDSPLMINLDL